MSDQARCKSPEKCKCKCKGECPCHEHCNSAIQELRCEIEDLKRRVSDLEQNQCKCKCKEGECCGGDNTDGGCSWGCSCGTCRKGSWVPASNGTVPPGTVKSAESPPYWVAHAQMDSESLVPGKLTPAHNTCWVAWNDTEIKMNEYETLVDADCKWVPHTSSEPIPCTAVLGGHLEGGKEKLFIGRAFINSILVPGYVFQNSRELLHSTGYKNERKTAYEILVYNCYAASNPV